MWVQVDEIRYFKGLDNSMLVFMDLFFRLLFRINSSLKTSQTIYLFYINNLIFDVPHVFRLLGNIIHGNTIEASHIRVFLPQQKKQPENIIRTKEKLLSGCLKICYIVQKLIFQLFIIPMNTPSPSFLQRVFGKLSGKSSPDNRDELQHILRQACEQSILDNDTLSRIENLFKFNELNVRDAMMTRAQMNVIKTTDSIERIIAYTVDTAHSRFPVIEEDKDHIIGILHAKDLLKFTLNPEQFKLENILRPAVFVPESKPLNTLLKEFQTQRNHMAIVVDEYGGISGLVTFEDVIEQIVGRRQRRQYFPRIRRTLAHQSHHRNQRHQHVFWYNV